LAVPLELDCTFGLMATMSTPPTDPRLLALGWDIPTQHYSDQPYVVKTDDGAWLVAVTTAAGHEGAQGQHVITRRSTDQGRTWGEAVPVEPGAGPEASYAAMLKLPSGRIYIFYNHNTDNLRWIMADSPPYQHHRCTRVDSMGYHVAKFSDDHGRSWSAERLPLPVREMDIDRRNSYGGAVRFFWNVGRPFIHQGAAYVSLHKVGGFGDGFFTRSEGVLLRSPDLLTVTDPTKATWETLPDGDFGLRTPPGGGPVAEEQCYTVLSDGTFFACYRSIDGHPVGAYSGDGGHTWTVPEYLRFPDGRRLKHPRAATFIWRCAIGKYLYWFHHHGGHFITHRGGSIPYEDRNPAWLCGAVEITTPAGQRLKFSQPEVGLYDDDPFIRMSYPDMVEADGQYYFTETQKNQARVHPMPTTLITGLWQQLEAPGGLPGKGCVASWEASQGPMPASLPFAIGELLRRDWARADYGTYDARAGLTVELWLRADQVQPGQVLLSATGESGRALSLSVAAEGALELRLADGRSDSRWTSDAGTLKAGQWQHLVVIVDGGPKLILFVVDGLLQDGGQQRQFGWGRYNPEYRGPAGLREMHLAPGFTGELGAVRLYDRALRVSEAVLAQRAGR
jgi:hypothetical protein